MYVEKEVTYNKNNGPVSVNIRNAGYANQGMFNLHMTNGDVTIKIGENGKFGDGIPDIYLIPYNPAGLTDWMLIILGNYVPAYGHTQISVDYEFYQMGTLIQTEQIRVNGTSLIAHHDFTFKKAAK